MKSQKEKKYHKFFIKTEKLKSSIRFRFFCNNLSTDDFDKSSYGFMKANFTHKHTGMVIYFYIRVPERNIESFLYGKRIPDMKVYKHGKKFHIEYKVIDETYSQYLDMDFEAVPKQITLYKKYIDKELNAEVKIKIICNKRIYMKYLKSKKLL